ncbi:MAG: [acyl-carrier-protein] S-malonyltransferase [Legionellaceae bacterium]|nr:[acyl-carrier-protein] S-malonyltransferase [Legionellaceae bacterium]|tara:strand:+ start:117 stop:1058 length:942 start_codon:yes stop_codon:yes gene_type:complete
MNQTAFVFPGQGSQKVGMLKEVVEEFPRAHELFTEASDVLGYDLWQLISEGPAEKLNQTEFTQPALLAADIAMWQLWCDKGGAKPALMAGHSLGEYAALVAAESIAFADAIDLVAKRGRFMQSAVPEGVGAMAAIVMLSAEQVADICQQASEGEVLSLANLNEKQQTVIAGQADAVDRAVVLAKAAGAKIAKRLPVSVPSHCKLMKPAAEALSAALKTIEFKPPVIPVVNNVDVKINNESDAIRDALERQVFMPVRWYEVIETIVDQGVTRIIECGPGKVLTGQTRRINSDVDAVMMNNVVTLNTALTQEGEA